MTETTAAVQPKGEDTAKRKAEYLEIIKQYEREFSTWNEKGRQIVKRYMDDRNARQTNRRRFNILWSNVQTLLPALYFQPPKPNVERRYRDKDPLGRTTADIIERACSYFINDCDFSASCEQAVLDRLLPGRGVIWFRYVPHFKDMALQETPEIAQEGEEISDSADFAQDTNAASAQDAKPPAQELDYEEICTDYVHYEDFGHNVCRTWSEVTMVWRKVYLTRDELVARFGDEIGNAISLDHAPQDLKTAREIDDSKKGTVYELWDKIKKEAVWLHKDYGQLLDVKDDPLKLKKFFPCPEPLYTTRSNNDLIPASDYKQYQDQAGEMDELTARIYSLTKAIKVAGVYDASAPALANLLSEGVENRLIPVETWAVFAEKGGLKGAVDFIPIQEVVEALISLHEARDKVKETLYEITGLSDIMRGASDPSETATAQQIKGQYGSMRLGKMQQGVSRFIRDGVQIMGEIIAGHFSQKTLAMITGVDLFTQAEKQQVQAQQQQAQMMAQRAQQAPQPQGAPGSPPPAAPPQPQPLPPDAQKKLELPTWEEVESLLRNNAALHFRIGIETDSTIKADQESDKQARIEALEALGQFLGQSAAAPPQLQPFLGEALLFLVRGFKSARSLESAAEDLVSNLQEKPMQAPDPNAAKAQAQLQTAQLKAKTDLQKAQLDQQADVQTATVHAQTTQQIEQMKLQHSADMEKMRMQLDMVMKQMEVAGKIKEAAVTAAMTPAPVISGGGPRQ